MLEAIISWYAPHYCVGCDAEGSLLCANCAGSLPAVADRCYRCRALSPGGKTCVACRRHSKLTNVRAVTSYEGLAKDMVGRLKFSGAKAAARSISVAMSEVELSAAVVIVHIPTATSRIRLRGYDQAALIAKQLAGMSNLEYADCLRRIGQHRQVGASRVQRIAQMQQSLLVVNTDLIAGRHIVLVDDVMTTGASLESAAKVLRAAGAAKVEAVVFARA